MLFRSSRAAEFFIQNQKPYSVEIKKTVKNKPYDFSHNNKINGTMLHLSMLVDKVTHLKIIKEIFDNNKVVISTLEPEADDSDNTSKIVLYKNEMMENAFDFAFLNEMHSCPIITRLITENYLNKSKKVLTYSGIYKSHPKSKYTIIRIIFKETADNKDAIRIISDCVELSINHNNKIGAHPSFPDKKNFGRKTLKISKDDLSKSLIKQISSLEKIIICLL